jgi:hypothetical protein
MRSIRGTFIVLGLGFAMVPTQASADILARYEMGDFQGPFSAEATTVAPGVSATSITGGGGATISSDAEFSNPYLILDSDGDSYIQFTVDPAVLMNLDQPVTLSFDAKHPAATMNDSIEAQYSYDGSSFTSAAVFDGMGGTFSTFSTSIPDEAGAETDDLTVRFLAYRTPTGGGGPNPVTEHFDNITLNGVVVPEPASIAMVGAGALVLLARKRRSR